MAVDLRAPKQAPAKAAPDDPFAQWGKERERAPEPGLRFDILYNAEPNVALFHRSEAFVRGIRGPVGSGKSVGCVVEILRRGMEQAPDKKGVRRTRWAAIRNTYAELLTTTIKTWKDWVPEEIAPVKHTVPITSIMRVALPDGTTLHIEVIFVSCDRPDDVGKLKSLELTGIWLNEASEIDKAVMDMATARVGRFPAKINAPYTWCGVIMDTNSMDDEHWWYKLDREQDPEATKALQDVFDVAMRELGMAPRPLMQFFDQPPALIELTGDFGVRYEPNPNAENVKNHNLGAAYWLQQIIGKRKQWIDIYVLNRYGRVIDGLPIYPNWRDEFHGKPRRVTPIPGLMLVIGMDFGVTPAAAICQFTPKGQLLILAECVTEKGKTQGARQLYENSLRPFLAANFPGYRFRIVGDPAGNKRHEGDTEGVLTALGQLQALGADVSPASTNKPEMRKGAMDRYLDKQVDGEPALLIDSQCKVIRAGMAGRYHYRRVQTGGSEARYEEKPYKNHWSHVCEAAEYVALETADFEDTGSGTSLDDEPDAPTWMGRLVADRNSQPWKYRTARR